MSLLGTEAHSWFKGKGAHPTSMNKRVALGIVGSAAYGLCDGPANLQGGAGKHINRISLRYAA